MRLVMFQIMYPYRAWRVCSRCCLEHPVRYCQNRKSFSYPFFPAFLISDIGDYLQIQKPQCLLRAEKYALPSGKPWHWDILLHRNESLMWSGGVWMLTSLRNSSLDSSFCFRPQNGALALDLTSSSASMPAISSGLECWPQTLPSDRDSYLVQLFPTLSPGRWDSNSSKSWLFSGNEQIS